MAEPAPARELFRFGVFEVDARTGEVFKHGFKIRVQEQPFQVLLALLKRPGQLVTREELRQKLWADNVFLDHEHSLSKAVNKLREALADSTEHPRYIETLARRGYRFIAAVERIVGEINAAHVRHLGSGASHDREAKASKLKLLVLPFENVARNGDGYLNDGVTDEMIAQIQRLHPRGLSVVARATAMRYKLTNKTLAQVGTELGVDYILTGSVYCDSACMRLQIELIYSADEKVAWSDVFECELQRSSSVAKEVAAQVVRALAINLVPEHTIAPISTPQVRWQTYEAYLKGRFYWYKRTPAALTTATDYFEEAIATQPTYAPAHVGLAETYNMLANRGCLSPEQAFPKAKSAAKRAIELDECLAEAHSALGWAIFSHDWDWRVAEREFQLGLAQNPSSSVAHHFYGFLLIAANRFEQSITEILSALQIDPLSLPTNGILIWALFCARRYDEAIEQGRRTIEIDPNYPVGLEFLAMAYSQRGRIAEAVSAAERGSEASGRDPLVLTALGHIYAVAGESGKAQKLLGELMEIGRERYVVSALVAPICAALGRKNDAFSWLKRAEQERGEWAAMALVDPRLDSLRNDPRFDQFAARICPHRDFNGTIP